MTTTIKHLILSTVLTATCISTLHASEWGLHFEPNCNEPVVDMPADTLAESHAFYRDLSGDKVLYLTFDAGYEAGYTHQMIDTLNKHNAHGTFFLTGSYMVNNPDIVHRLLAENHTVANHPLTPPDMSRLSHGQFAHELHAVEELFYELTDTQLPKYYRPPKGAYTEHSLNMAKELGYKTVLWSLAYMDFDADRQPSHHTAYSKLLPKIHDGAVILLHNMSRTNAEILDGLLTAYRELGYTFESLEHFISPF